MDDPIYVFFNLMVSSTCTDAKIDQIVLDRSSNLLYGEFTRLSHGSTSCGDAGADHTFVVAIERSNLPTGHLTIRLERDFFVCADCGREREQVEIDL